MFWRERQEVSEIDSQEVDAWIEINYAAIYDEMEKRRLEIVKDGTKKKVGRNPLLDRSKRWLSEMPICGFISNIDLPPGFKKEVNDIYVSPFKEERHWFAVSGDNRLCFTPGQFVEPENEELAPGERIKILQEKAPDLIRVFDDGVARLYGEKEDIFQRLGIAYRG